MANISLNPTPFGGEFKVSSDAKGNVSLTDLWKASGKDRNFNPNEWIRQDSSQQLIEAACSFLNTGIDRIITSKRGKGGGTYAHKQIALAYAKYLSPELHIAVNNVFFERLEEQKNPELAIDRAVNTWKAKGKDDKWISTRLKGKAERQYFTGVLAAHGVNTTGFKDCTNAIYEPLWGGGAEVVRSRKSLPVKSNTRESMSTLELMAVSLSEHLAAENIERKRVRGNFNCASECRKSSKLIAAAIHKSKE